jgi:septal ring factor EnvC (AmiA/AmiB activator)
MNLPRANQIFCRRCRLAVLLGVAIPLGAIGVAAGQAETLDALKQREQELEAVRSAQEQASENEARLRREIESISADRRKLNADLIATASRVRAVEGSIAVVESRLKPLGENEQSIRKSLDGRRAVITEVLAALQRMGRRPPPALLVQPDDALEAVRSAMMLGAVLPEMRQQAASLASELADLVRVRKEIAAEHDRLQADRKALAEQQQRLTLLTAERQKQLAETEGALAATRKKVVALARDAENLKDLIAKLEKGLDSATRTARTKQDGAQAGSRPADLGRLTPAIAFASARGTLPLPVNGVKMREFGDPDGHGGAEKGLLLATRSRAQVTAPCDGWVVYAGAFRSYGQLLILNAGGGYHVLLAGMERISVDIGQFTRNRLQSTRSLRRVPQGRNPGRSQPVVGS